MEVQNFRYINGNSYSKSIEWRKAMKSTRNNPRAYCERRDAKWSVEDLRYKVAAFRLHQTLEHSRDSGGRISSGIWLARHAEQGPEAAPSSGKALDAQMISGYVTMTD